MFGEIVVFYLFVLVFQFGVSQVLLFGECDEVDTVKYFDLEKFLGTWYEIQRFPTWYEKYGQCAYKKINYCECSVEIEHGFVKDQIEYVLHVNTTYNPGDEAVFKIDVNNVDPVGIPLLVVATNYVDYAVVYGCKYDATVNVKYVSVWILSRLKTLSEENLLRSHDVISTIPQISTAYLEDVSQTEEMCNHYWTAHIQAENTTDTFDVRQALFIK